MDIIYIIFRLLLLVLFLVPFLLMLSSPIIAVLSFYYFYIKAPVMNKPKGDAIVYAILVIMANVAAIFLTYLGVGMYGARYALNARSHEYTEFMSGTGQTFMNISYAMPFLVLFICMPALVDIFMKPKKEINITDN